MKAGELKRIAADYQGLLGAHWKRVGSEFMRRADDWVQILGFNPSRFDDTYVPKCSLEFLKMPGDFSGGFLPQELQHTKHKVQRWVSLKEHQQFFGAVFEAMSTQFKPAIETPLTKAGVRDCLREDLAYWPHPYALCVMAAEEGDASGADRWFKLFVEAVADRPYEWADTRRAELKRCLDLMRSAELSSHLAAIQAAKLSALKASL